MKKGTLTMTYKDASGSGSMVLEEADGKYVATIPAGATEVKFVCEWEEKEEEEEPVNAAAQVTGALGVAVVLNDNDGNTKPTATPKAEQPKELPHTGGLEGIQGKPHFQGSYLQHYR